MKKKILSLIALGLVCVPFVCNAETVDSTHIAYTENYFGLNEDLSESQLIIDDVKEYDKLTFKQNRHENTGRVELKKDAKIGGFDIFHNPLTYVANGVNVVSELPGDRDDFKFIMEGEGSITVYGVYLGVYGKIDSETIKTAYYGDTCVKDSDNICYYFKTKEDFAAKFDSLKTLSVNKGMDSKLTSDDFVNGTNKASIKEDEDHKWITKEWINEHITTDMNIVYNDNGSVTFTSEKEEEKAYSLKSNLNVVFTSKTELNKAYTLKTPTIKAADYTLDGYTSISGYDISVYNGNQVVEMKNGDFEITIPIAVKYDKYVVAYVKDGKIVETIDASYKDGFVTFKTTHLSEYVVFGKNLNNGSSETANETEKNPQTGDNILVMLAGLILSGSALIYAGAKKLKRN